MTLLFSALANPEPQKYKNQDIRNMAGRKIISWEVLDDVVILKAVGLRGCRKGTLPS